MTSTLAVDWGTKVVGLAISYSGKIATELKAVPTAYAIEEISNLIYENNVSALVIGLPSAKSGKATSQTTAIQKIGKKLVKLTQLKIYFENEAFSSNEANRLGGSHSLAAKLILEQFMNNLIVKNEK